jgi:RES domain-containing protein
VPPEDLLARVERLGAVALETTALRHVSVGRDPCSGTGAKIHGGRWNPPNSFATIYLALEEATLFAEFERAARRQGLAPDDFLPRDLHRLAVKLTAVLDLRESAAREAIRLTEHELRGDNREPCRAIGRAAHDLGLEGVLAPSATGSGTVLAVFPDDLAPGSVLTILSSEAWARKTRRRKR